MKTLLLILAFLQVTTCLFPQETAQWRGSDRDGFYSGTGLLTTWPPEGPPLLWSSSGIGKGFTTAVSDGKAIYITGMMDSTDYLTAIDRSGKVLWQIPFGPAWDGSYPDTRCTPTVENGIVYLISGSGSICSVSATDGKKIWSFDAVKKFGAAYGDWGVCESLLLVDNKVIYTPAGQRTTMVALDKSTGETVWESKTLNDTSAYVSPRLIRVGDQTLIVTLTATYLIGVDPANGDIRWKFNFASYKPEKSLKVWPGAPRTNTITPLCKDGFLYITGGYDHGGVMLRIAPDASSVSVVWSDSTLDCHHGGVVLLDGHIYGSNWLDNSRGNWCCLDWKTGRTMYEQKWNTKGSIIACDDMLYLFDEKNGHAGLLKPDPLKFTLNGSFKVPLGTGPCWAHPSIYDGILFIRRGDVLMAYDIKRR